MMVMFHKLLTPDECESVLDGGIEPVQERIITAVRAAVERTLGGTVNTHAMTLFTNSDWKADKGRVVFFLPLLPSVQYEPDCKCPRAMGTLSVCTLEDAPRVKGTFIGGTADGDAA